MLRVTDRLAAQARTLDSAGAGLADDEDGEVEQEVPEEVKIAEQLGEFDEIVVWGHGGVVDEGSDLFVRGVREWVGFAEAMHCDDDDEEEEEVERSGGKQA